MQRVAKQLRMEKKMKVYFAPIPPDTIASLKHDMFQIAEKFDLQDYLPKCIAWASILDMFIPDDENSRNFIQAMKRICEVKVVNE